MLSVSCAPAVALASPALEAASRPSAAPTSIAGDAMSPVRGAGSAAAASTSTFFSSEGIADGAPGGGVGSASRPCARATSTSPLVAAATCCLTDAALLLRLKKGTPAGVAKPA